MRGCSRRLLCDLCISALSSSFRGPASSQPYCFGAASAVLVAFTEVNQGSQEQTRGIEEVARAVLQMQAVTQSTAAGAEESAAAAEELNAQSEALKHVVRRLTAMVGGA